jgi:hypothetical protein
VQCGNKCITKNQCCKNKDCANNQRCDNKTNKCGCSKNQQTCQGKCIKKTQCCGDAQCTGAQAGDCVDNLCRAAFETCTNDEGDIAFVKGPGNPPVSDGSVQFTVGPDPAVDDWAHLRFAEFADTPLGDIESLEYSVLVRPLDNGSCPTFNPYLALYVTANNADHVMVSTTNRPEPESCDTWQTLDLAGAGNAWWSPTLGDFAPQSSPRPLSAFVDEYPGIAIRNAATTDPQCPAAVGGLRLEAGEWPGGGGTGNAVTHVSFLRVSTTSKTRTFRF